MPSTPLLSSGGTNVIFKKQFDEVQSLIRDKMFKDDDDDDDDDEDDGDDNNNEDDNNSHSDYSDEDDKKICTCNSSNAVSPPGWYLNIKMSSDQYWDPRVKDKMVLWPSYL